MCFQCTSSFCLTDKGSLCCGAFSHTERSDVPVLIFSANSERGSVRVCTANNFKITFLLLSIMKGKKKCGSHWC